MVDLGLDVTETPEGFLYGSGPDRFIAIGQGLIQKAGTGFWAGLGVDFLAYRLGGYDKAVEFALQHYRPQLQARSALPLESLVEQFVMELESARNLFLAIFDLRDDILRDARLVEPQMWCRKSQIDLRHAHLIVYGCHGLRIQKAVGEPASGLNGRLQYIVLPAMSNPWTYSCLHVLDPRTDKVTAIELDDVSHSYFGLHTILGSEGPAMVYPDGKAAAMMAGFNNDMSRQRTASLALLSNPGGLHNPFRLPVGTVSISSEFSLQRMLDSRQAFEKLAAVNLLTSAPMDLNGYISDEFIKSLRDTGPLLPNTMVELDRIKADPELLQMILDKLHEQGRTSLITRLKQHVDINRSFEHKGVVIKETGAGYVAMKGGSMTSFSNFVFRIDRNVWFPDTQSMFHSGRLIFQGQECPMLLDHRHTGSIVEISTAARAAVIRAGLNIDKTPVMTDTTYRAGLAYVLGQQAGQVPKVDGLDRLGWNQARDRFTTPMGQIALDGIHPVAPILHPSRSALHDYSFATIPEGLVLDNPISNQVLCLLANYVVRSFMGAECLPVRVENTEPNRALLLAAFGALGQSCPMIANPNVRKGSSTRLEGIETYPALFTASHDDVFNSLSGPVVCLAQAGMGLTQEVGNWEGLAGQAWTVLKKLTAKLMRDRPLLQIEPRSDFLLYRYGRDGRDYLKTLLGICPSLPQDGQEMLYDLLMESSEAEFNKLFHFKIDEECVTLNTRRAHMLHDDLLNACRALDPDVESRGSTIRLAPDRIGWAASSLYGRHIAFRDGHPSARDPQNILTVSDVETG